MRHIVHVDLDTFYVSVERVKNKTLIEKPVLIGGMSDRSVVASCSYETRKFGVRSGMPMKRARQLCPEALIIRADFEAYSKYSATVRQIIDEKAPLYEQSSIDEFYIDISGMDQFIGCFKWAQELTKIIKNNTGLPLSFGLSVNKTVAKIATGEAKPHGQLEIPLSKVRPFLNPLPVRKIPGIGDKTNRLLETAGIRTIQTLSMFRPEVLERLIGKSGLILWEKANGIDNTPVTQYREAKSISTEETFEVDSKDMATMKAILVAMTEKLSFQLRQQKELTGCITVKIRYGNFDTHTKQTHIPFTSYDHVLIERVKELFDKVYDKTLLVRLIGVKFSKLVYGYEQIDLFEDPVSLARLYTQIDKIRAKHGIHVIKRGNSV